MTDIKIAYATAVKSAGIVPVRLGSATVNAQCPQDLTVASGDPLLVARIGSLYMILARYFTSAVAPPPADPPSEPPVAPVHSSGTNTFIPTRTASYRTADAFSAGWRTDTDDIYQGEFGSNGSHTGCAFYGNQVKSLAGATVTQAWIKARRKSSGGITAAQTTTMGRITQSAKPAGAPTFTNSFTGPALAWGQTTTKFLIPNAAAQALVDGTAGGLGIHVSGSPYVILQGKSSYGGAFALTVKWVK